MEFEFFIGIDVSKNELDFSVMQGKDFLFHKEIENKPSTVLAFLKDLSRQPGFTFNNSVFCMEHTGIYNNHLLVALFEKHANISLESAAQIKSSLGKLRGKNDKVDSIRIAGYAYKCRHELRLWSPKRDQLISLSHLAATRSRLLEAQKLLKTPLKESRSFVKKSLSDQSSKICSNTLNSIKKDLQKAEKAIRTIIESDQELNRLFNLITSVGGIGPVTATQILITTNEFKDIKDPKKFSCYSGVVPFTKESGLFKGRGRVSHLANKKMKMLLHMSALVAIQYNSDMKAYFERRTKEDKKNKMSVLNAVRNKLILRIFSCVNQNRMYEKNYQRLVA